MNGPEWQMTCFPASASSMTASLMRDVCIVHTDTIIELFQIVRVKILCDGTLNLTSHALCPALISRIINLITIIINYMLFVADLADSFK